MQIDNVTQTPPIIPPVQTPPEDIETTPPPPPSEPEVSEQETEEIPGALRLLLEGHFKGVADIRQRIHFADEIAAMETEAEAEALEETATQQSTALLDTVNSAGQAQTEADDDVAAAFDEFNQAVTGATDSFLESETPDATELLGNIGSAFDALIAALTPDPIPVDPLPDPPPADPDPIIDPPLDPPPADPDPIPDPPLDPPPADPDPIPDPPPPVDEMTLFIEELTSIFTAAMDAMTDAMNNTSGASASALPPLSQPSGNGKAYDKFLAIYNGLNAPDPDPSTEPPVDSTA